MSTNPSHEALSAAWAGFAIDIYKACVAKASDSSPNVAFSPYSIAVACLMVAFGSKGETRQQMMQAMHCTALDSSGLEEATGGLAKALSDAAPSSSSNPSDAAPVVLDIANRLFCQNGYPFLPDYLEKLKSKCSAGVDFLDFVARAEEAREQMNAWIAETTRNRITRLFQKDSVKPDTRMVLANAVYFKGSWAEKFSKDATFPETFHVAPGKEVQVPTMRQNSSFAHGYFEAGKAQTLTLPYVGKELAMLLLLPDEKDGLAQLESALAGADIMRMMTEMQEEEIDVQLPRFKIEGELPLAEVLQQLGMVDMFSDKADLSGMDGSRQLYVSDAKHKAFLEVDEEGSEAAAVTAMMVCMRGVLMKPEFIVNHPFVFAIVHRPTGTVLFLGRMVDPSL